MVHQHIDPKPLYSLQMWSFLGFSPEDLALLEEHYLRIKRDVSKELGILEPFLTASRFSVLCNVPSDDKELLMSKFIINFVLDSQTYDDL